MSKVGRNEPCPCGSGIKYKNCHLRGETLTIPPADVWRSLHDLTIRLPAELLRFASSRYESRVFDDAWNEFTSHAQEKFDRDSVHLPVFMPWFFYQWDPDPHDTKLTPEQVAEFPLAAAYLSRRWRLSPRTPHRRPTSSPALGRLACPLFRAWAPGIRAGAPTRNA